MAVPTATRTGTYSPGGNSRKRTSNMAFSVAIHQNGDFGESELAGHRHGGPVALEIGSGLGR